MRSTWRETGAAGRLNFPPKLTLERGKTLALEQKMELPHKKNVEI